MSLQRRARALQRLHERFIIGGSGPSYLDDPELLDAYLAWFDPASEAQVGRVLAELPRPAGATPLRVLDVGCGTGPAARAVARWAGAPVSAVGLDRSPRALREAEARWPRGAGDLRTRVWNAHEPLPAGPWDLVIMCHVLNELEQVPTWPDCGLLVLVEPATREAGRRLLRVRDEMIAQGWRALGPCTHQRPCPALARERDWCHADRPWDPPAPLRELGDAAGLDRERLKMSWVALDRGPAEAEDPQRLRVVGDMQVERGKRRIFACGPEGFGALVELGKRPVPGFDGLERGDLVTVRGGELAGDGLRPEAVVVEKAASSLD